jgi:hypothetical protein
MRGVVAPDVSVAPICEHVFVAVTPLERTQLDEVRAIAAESRAFLSDFDAGTVSVPEATEFFETAARIERAWAAVKMLVAPRVESAATWRRAGYRSTAEQLAGIAGTSVVAARSMLEASKQIDDLPSTAAAVRTGELSMAKAEIIASAATIAPEAEPSLLENAASLPLAEVREKGLRARATDRDETYARIKRQRRVHDHVDAEGRWKFYAGGPADDGARVRNALDPIIDEVFKAARAEGRQEPREAYAYDAFMELVRRASQPNDGTTKAPAPRFMALVRVDHAALVRGSVEGDEVCEIAGLGPIPVQVARDLLGEAVVKLVITKGVDVANITHIGRGPKVAQQVALWWRSPTCDIEGCTRTQRLENDHSPDWAQTHHTRVDELFPKCDHHHDLKTYFGWDVIAGTRRMVPPDHPDHPRNKPPPDP